MNMNVSDKRKFAGQHEILDLMRIPECIPTLVRWFKEEWSPWYGTNGAGDAEADLLACCNDGLLPLAVVAVDGAGRILGTAALKSKSPGSELGIGPWLAALLVDRPFRRHGVGDALVGAIEARARKLGLKNIYVSADAGTSLFRHRGWLPTGRHVESLRGPVDIFRISL